jgi:hypothetical protein
LNDGVVWPLNLTGRELAELMDSLGLEVAATSPIARLEPDTSAPASPAADRMQPPPAVARALRVLAAPRQLLLLRLGQDADADAGDTRVLGFLNDGEFVARFDIGTAGCTIAEPCTHDRFAQLVCSLAGVEAQSSTENAILMSQKFLEAIIAFRSTGLFDHDGACISLADAEAAVTSAGNDAACAYERLCALAADGLLAIEGSTVLAGSGWRDTYPFLSVPARLQVDAIELADIAAERTRKKRLAVLLGGPAGRVVLLPTTCYLRGREVMLELTPATTSAVASAVEQLLTPPLAPPLSPVIESGESLRKWLDGPQGSEPLPEWHLQALEEIMVPLDGTVAIPAALLAPQATVEILSTTRGGARFEHTILALDATHAVEWTLDGSLVMWRALDPGHVHARIDELIPLASYEGVGTASYELPAAGLRWLLGGTAHAPTDLPRQLRALANDKEVGWCAIRATHCTRGANQSHTMLLASQATGGTWSFELEDDAFTARITDSSEIRAKVASALAVTTTALVSANQSTHAG